MLVMLTMLIVSTWPWEKFWYCISGTVEDNNWVLKKKSTDIGVFGSLRNQPTFSDATTGFPAKWRLRNEHRTSTLMTRNYPDLGSASHWLNQISHVARPIISTTQIWVVTRHQYGISAPIFQRSFGRETSGSVAKCRLFSLTIMKENIFNFNFLN